MREVLQHGDYRQAIWTEHEQIMRTIAAHDGDGAQALVRAHLRQAARNVALVLPDTGGIGPDSGGHSPATPR